MSARGMQAKDIDDRALLTAVDRLSRGANYYLRDARWFSFWELEPELPAAPHKVLHARVKALHRRGLMAGCFCGCRGDYGVTDTGPGLATASRVNL